MPLRVYRCPQCGREIEYLERKEGDKPQECECGNKELILVPASFSLKVR